MPNVFEEAFASVESVDLLVQNRIKDASDTSKELLAVALDTVDALQHVNFGFNAGPPPSPPNIDSHVDVTLNLPAIHPTSFGAITSTMPDDPTLENVPGFGTLTIPDFVSSISSLSIPVPPVWTAPGSPPTRPDVGDVTLPVPPSFALPALPTLEDIVVPTFAGLTLPTFDTTAPEFEGTPLVAVLQWTDPVYHPTILNEVMDKIRSLWSGGSGIPAAVEQAMVERAMSREDLIASREIDSVAEEFSLRGFTMPSGLQAARVDQLTQDLAIKKLALNRELTIEFAKFQIENIRFAVTSAIAAENVLVNIFLNMANRTFEAAKFQVESQINIYNAQVALFNARMNGFGIRAQVFDTLVKAELTKLEVYKAEIEAELARGQLNVQKVQAYTAQVQALGAQVEIYKAQMQGASIQTDIIRTRIEAYKADVQAYAERINADKVRFDAYESQVKGEAAKAGIIDSEARAYAALIQGKATAVEIDVKRADVAIQKNRARIDAFVALVEAEKARVQSQSAVIQAGAQAYTADSQRFSAQAQAETAKAQVQVAAKETELRTNVAFYQAQVQSYLGYMEQLIRQCALVVQSLTAAGQITGTLAAGSMAGVHVGANLNGSGSVSAGGNYSDANSKSESTSTNTNYNYEGT